MSMFSNAVNNFAQGQQGPPMISGPQTSLLGAYAGHVNRNRPGRGQAPSRPGGVARGPMAQHIQGAVQDANQQAVGMQQRQPSDPFGLMRGANGPVAVNAAGVQIDPYSQEYLAAQNHSAPTTLSADASGQLQTVKPATPAAKPFKPNSQQNQQADTAHAATQELQHQINPATQKPWGDVTGDPPASDDEAGQKQYQLERSAMEAEANIRDHGTSDPEIQDQSQYMRQPGPQATPSSLPDSQRAIKPGSKGPATQDVIAAFHQRMGANATPDALRQELIAEGYHLNG